MVQQHLARPGAKALRPGVPLEDSELAGGEGQVELLGAGVVGLGAPNTGCPLFADKYAVTGSHGALRIAARFTGFLSHGV